MNKRRLLSTFVMGMLLVLAVALGTARGSSDILYAKTSASGAGDCSSWANACTLQHALEDVAAYGDEIWVVAGVYTPTTTGTDRTATFQLLSGVAVYGGFVGTETSRDQRDWESNITVLSADIDHNDITDPSGVITATSNISGSNSYHVVTSSSVTETCVLDGFAITGGYADGSPPYSLSYGGGMYNVDSSPTLANLTFSGNSANITGGGMSNHSSSPTLTNVTFSGNCTALSGSSGGGMFNAGGNPELTNVTFIGNSAPGGGGGMNNSVSSPHLRNVTFIGNSAMNGGGVYDLLGSPTFTNVTFTGNSAGDGGGMDNGSATPTLINVSFIGNSANQAGGMANSHGHPTLINVTFAGNSAQYGGGILNTSISSATLINVTFSHNSASNQGGGMYNDATSTISFANCILWGNTSPLGAQIRNGSSTATISHSLIQDSGGSGAGWDSTLGTDGGGNIDADPQLVDADGPDDIAGTLDDNLRLSAGSPAIDAGDNSALPPDTLDLDADGNTTETLPLDLDGSPRVLRGTVDMGPYEWPLSVLTVTKTLINDDGGSAAVPDFQAYLDGQPSPWGVAQAVVSGTHTVSESVLPGYVAAVWGGDCNEDGTIALNFGENAICSITNDDIGPTVTLTKTVVNDDGGTATAADFQAYVQGDPVPWAVAHSVISGTYTVSESVEAGYSASVWSGDCAPGGTITLAVGEEKTCYVSNDDIAPTLTLTKTVINDDGGSATIVDFQAYVRGNPVPWGVAQSVISGTYTVSETVHAGYSASAWSGDCASDGTITLATGDDKTCSITNDDLAPTLTLTKTVVNDDGGGATAADFQAYLDGEPVPWGVPQPVMPGTHAASETVLLGYKATTWGGDCDEDGSITLSVGEDAVCSITNDDMLRTFVPLVLKNYGP